MSDPAAAVAIAKCILARRPAVVPTVQTSHPRPCRWCARSTDDLLAALERFNAWAAYDDRSNSYRRYEVRVFVDLPKERQAELVACAQRPAA
jgi:hypothetical protein